MTDQHTNPSADLVNEDSSTVDVNSLNQDFKAPGVHTKHIGLLRPPMIAVYLNWNDEPLFLKIDEPKTFGRNTLPGLQTTLIELGNASLEQGVSRQHARINWQNGQLLLEDLGSSNGTFVNQVQLAPHFPKSLSSGDVVQLGQLALAIYFATESPADLPAEGITPQNEMPSTNVDSSQRAIDITQPVTIEYASTLRLTNGLIEVEDLLLNATNQIVPDGEITLKLRQAPHSNSTLVLEIAVTDPVVQKAIQAIFSDKPVLEMDELKMRITRLVS